MPRLLNWSFFYRPILADIPFEEEVDELKDFDERFRIILRRHLSLLAWWSLLTALVGLPSIFLGKGIWPYFWMMTVSWAAINFGIVLGLLGHTAFQQFARGNTFDRFRVQRHIEKMLLFNIGLDTAYVFAGLWLHTLGRLPDIAHPELWTGRLARQALLPGPATCTLTVTDKAGNSTVEKRQVRLPMRPGQRSLNLSNAVAVAVFEAWRQNGYAGGV